MCKPMSEGGKRCAAHTRPRFEVAIPGTADWDDAAAAYAATKEGSQVLSDLRDEAHAQGDILKEVACDAALRRAEDLNQVANETAARVAAAIEAGDVTATEEYPDSDMLLTLPNGQQINLHMMPDRAVFEPQTKTLDDGNYQTVYVAVNDHGISNDSLHDYKYLLSNYNAELLEGNDTQAMHHALGDWVATEKDNDLGRVTLVRKVSDNPSQYEHRNLGTNFFSDGGDTDEWKAYDAAIILDKDRSSEDDGWGFVDDLNHAAHGKVYTVVVVKTAPHGQHLNSMEDDYDGTIVDPDDANARADAYHQGHMGDPFDD